MPKRWGIYRGLNLHTDALSRWKEPKCTKCNSDLTAWIDWRNHGSIGYCEQCEQLNIVKSDWIPAPNTHSRLEIEELLRHNVFPIDTSKLSINVNELWHFHENIPLENSQVVRLNSIIKELDDSEDSKILKHLIWSLIFNSSYLNEQLIDDYIEFTFKNPHYIKTSRGNIWIGDEIDIVERIEKSHPKELVKSLYKLWSRYNSSYSNSDFKLRVGFYIPKNSSISTIYGEQFLNFTHKAKRRKF